MRIICLADNSHEMFLFFGEKKQQIFENVICCSYDWYFKNYRIQPNNRTMYIFKITGKECSKIVS